MLSTTHDLFNTLPQRTTRMEMVAEGGTRKQASATVASPNLTGNCGPGTFDIEIDTLELSAPHRADINTGCSPQTRACVRRQACVC